ncbi:RNaseH domain-containing protein [Nocardia sp. SYP-A9097]|uniref:RNaseH domain-containing protein n=1 Tax=Nocardia sp. SYP-A9097 TaxID=2663237 RepID=UPI0018917D50|nr:RNaseH domain-containing protein [Nocardia sp. SYP-A9097]
MMGGLDLIEHDGWSQADAIAELMRTKGKFDSNRAPAHPSLLEWTVQAIPRYLAAREAEQADTEGSVPQTIPIRFEWAALYDRKGDPDSRGATRYERSVWGRRYASADGSVRDIWLPSINRARSNRSEAEKAAVADVLATGEVCPRPGFERPYRPLRNQPPLRPVRVRAFGYGCGDDKVVPILDWDQDEVRGRYREYAAPAFARAAAGSAAVPGSSCGDTGPGIARRAADQWLNGSGVRGAVVYSNHMGVHGIGAGLMSHQRSVITEWAEQALPDGLVRTESLSRSAVGTSKPANARPAVEGQGKRAEELRAAHARRGALAAAVVRMRSAELEAVLDGPPIFEARLLWQTASSRRAAITGLAEILGLEEKSGAPMFDDGSPEAVEAVFDTAEPGNAVVYEWRTPELTVRLRCLPLSGGLADKLALDPKVRPQSVALTAAVAGRRGELAKFLSDDGSDPGSPTLALVEIAHRSTFRPATTDPKFVMRLGCADAGVLTQFVVVPSNAKGVKTEKNVDHRVRSGWLDGLRQLGVRVLPEHTLGGSLPEDLRYAAIWMVKRRKDGPTRLPLHLPVAVLMTPMPEDSGRVQVQGWDDDTKSWTPYPKFLLGLVKKAEIPGVEVPAGQWITNVDWRKNMDQQRKETASFLQRMLFSLRDQPTVLIAHSQNSRQHWPWLQDGNTVVDLIKTGHAPPATLDPNLRLVRIRGGAGRETPQWWGTGRPDGINGLPAGLWTLPTTPGADHRIFYSTTEKASQFKKSAVSANRLAPRAVAGSGKNWTIDADKPAWNPSLVEIAVLGCHPTAEENRAGDDPEALALAMHQLRQAPDYLDALSLPLPLHLAGLAQAYVLPMLAADEDSDDPDLEIDTISDDLDPDLASAPGLSQELDPTEEPALSIW